MTAVVIFIIFIVLFVIWVAIRLAYIPMPSPHTLYFGAVRSGKTMFLTKLAVKLQKKGFTIFSNYPINYPNIYQLRKRDFGAVTFPPGSILLFDEASLSGFDNRDFKDNFKNNNALEYFKLVGHFKNLIVWSNQGWDELDKKIRTLCSSLYLVRRLPLISIAVRIYMDPGIDDVQNQPVDKYHYANFFRLVFDPRCLFFVLRSKYGQLYNSWEHPEYSEPDLKQWYSPGGDSMP